MRHQVRLSAVAASVAAVLVVAGCGATETPVEEGAPVEIVEEEWFREIRLADWTTHGGDPAVMRTVLHRIQKATGKRENPQWSDTAIEPGPGNWITEWTTAADEAMSKADTARSDGDSHTARSQYRAAAVYFTEAAYPQHRETAREADAFRMAKDAYENAARSRRDHWRAEMPGKRARPVRREAARKRTCTTGTSLRGPPNRVRQGLLRPGPVPGQALHRDRPAHRPRLRRPRGLRRHRRAATRPHRQPSPRTNTPRPTPARRSRPDPAHHPRDQAPDRRGHHHTTTTRTRNPLGQLAPHAPSTLTLVPQTHQTRPQHRKHPGQLANGGCRTSGSSTDPGTTPHPRQLA